MCLDGWKGVVVKLENSEAVCQSLWVTSVKSDGQIEETELRLRGLVWVVLPQANVGEWMVEERDAK